MKLLRLVSQSGQGSIRICLIFSIILMLGLMNGCASKNGMGNNPGGEAAKAPIGPPKAVKSSDGLSQLTVPSSWNVESDLNSDAKLQISNRANEEAALLFTENKEDLQAAGISLDTYSEEGYKPLMTRLIAAKVSAPTKLTINGSPAIQYQIEGEPQKTQDKSNLFNGKTIYLYTAIESPKHYHQLITWTTSARFEQNRAELQQLIQSLTESPAK